jgi:transcription initiation factor TFIIE subunit alpha
MSQKSITDLTSVQGFLETIGGKGVVELVKICERKRKAFTDEEVSKKMNLKVTEVRALLNKLHFRGIATYQKSRNQKTGWYNYTWEINKPRLANLIIDQQKEQLEKLSEKKAIEADYNLFDCNNCNERLPFEIAAEYNFLCPECGGNMDSANNPQKQKEINKQIIQIERELVVLSELSP